MAYLRTSRTRSRGLRVPSRITGINYASPLTEGLQAALPATFDLPVGFDLVSGTTWPLTSAAGVQRYYAGRGGGQVPLWGTYNSVANLHFLTAPASLSTNWPTSEGTALTWYWKHAGVSVRGAPHRLGSSGLSNHYKYGSTNDWYDDSFSTTRTGPHDMLLGGHLGTEASLVGATFSGGSKSLYILDAETANEVTTQTGLTFGLNSQLVYGEGGGSSSKSSGSTGGILLLSTALDRDTMVNARSWFWDAFNPRPVVTYFIPAAAGGPTTHTITPSGGITFAGSGVYQYARTHDVSGGVQLAGSAALKATRIHDVSGGVQFAGTSTFNVSRDIVPDGGVQLGGSATQTNVRVHDVSGGLSFSGAAGMQATRVLSPSGGLSLGGTGNFTGVEAGLTIVPSGGIQFGGGASGTLWPDNLAYGGFAHRVARKVADDVADDVTDFHRRYDD